jgi:hypothetical protein
MSNLLLEYKSSELITTHTSLTYVSYQSYWSILLWDMVERVQSCRAKRSRKLKSSMVGLKAKIQKSWHAFVRLV